MDQKNKISNLPTPSVGGLSVYLAQIKKFPMLDAEEEYMLAKNWRENGNFDVNLTIFFFVGCINPRVLACNA